MLLRADDQWAAVADDGGSGKAGRVMKQKMSGMSTFMTTDRLAQAITNFANEMAIDCVFIYTTSAKRWTLSFHRHPAGRFEHSDKSSLLALRNGHRHFCKFAGIPYRPLGYYLNDEAQS